MNDLAFHQRPMTTRGKSAAYAPPPNVREIDLGDLLARHGGEPFEPKQLDLVFGKETGQAERRSTKPIWYAGNLDSLRTPAVAIVGTRNVTEKGAIRARKLARGLATAGVAVVSGLAEGVDTEALTEAMNAGGRVAAVIGTPIDKAYPAKNAALQEAIYRDHLLISQFPVGTRTFRSHFPERNRLMAAVSDATVVIEASDTSGTLHQSAECVKLGRWLFIAKSVVEDPGLTWPAKFLDYENCVVLERVEDVLDRIMVRQA
jgi:DNA processing protein